MERVEAYEPCACGLHVCGISANGEEPITIANFPMSGPRQAQAVFNAMRAEFEAEPDDLIVDLCISRNDMIDNFGIPRQMLERFTRALSHSQDQRSET